MSGHGSLLSTSSTLSRCTKPAGTGLMGAGLMGTGLMDTGLAGGSLLAMTQVMSAATASYHCPNSDRTESRPSLRYSR